MKKPADITLVTDSRYLLEGMTQWIHGWKRNGWRNASKQPVKNADLWMALDAAARAHRIRWEWVRGHSGHPMNERADALANEAIAAMLEARQS
jgi:ribonuclease HI